MALRGQRGAIMFILKAMLSLLVDSESNKMILRVLSGVYLGRKGRRVRETHRDRERGAHCV